MIFLLNIAVYYHQIKKTKQENHRQSFFISIGKLILSDVFVNLIQEADKFFSPVVVPKSDPDCSVAVEYDSLQSLVNFNHTILYDSGVNVFYYELFLHLGCLLVENEQITRHSVDHLFGLILQLKSLCCSALQQLHRTARYLLKV